MSTYHLVTHIEPQVLREGLARYGFVLCTGIQPEEAGRDFWGFTERLLGLRPRMVERQPIQAVEGGHSFASTSRFTPLHTDSQLYDGAPPDLQVMACHHADEGGGESLLLDTWSLLTAIEERDPELFITLFRAWRIHPFVFGDLTGPTVALRGNALAFTHSPRSREDAVGQRLATWLEHSPPLQVPVRAGEVLLLDNRRVLHGRRAFQDVRRCFTRLLVWLPEPLARHPRYEALAQEMRREVEVKMAGVPAEARRRAGFSGKVLPVAEERLQIVLAMLRGAPPGVLAARYRVPEPTLYVWRDEALRAALEVLDR
ncbi:MAG: TauD/TfdA family dioxygenase [Myxococcales bacterium]|nr:TauD/TfdA family dioxygenase [Polyangiaceae bacterium]MDW8252085.1 TauD/TfdA family dioxygenase [Myxococcales bacterium]